MSLGPIREQARLSVGEAILAAAAVRIGRQSRMEYGLFGVLPYACNKWRSRGLGRLPHPAYLVVTATEIVVFGLRFGIETQLIGPARRWDRLVIRGRIDATDSSRVLLSYRPDRDPLVVTAIGPVGHDWSSLVSMLVSGPLPSA